MRWIFPIFLLLAIAFGHAIGYFSIGGFIANSTYTKILTYVTVFALIGSLGEAWKNIAVDWSQLVAARTARERALKSVEILLEFLSSLIKAALSSFLLTGVGCLAWVLLKWISAWALDPETGRLPALVLCVPLALSAGLGLFLIRKNARIFYGCTEVLVGLIVALQQVWSVGPETSVLNQRVLMGLLTAGVYLIVRGMDNVDVGLQAGKPDAVFEFIRTRSWFSSRKKH
jgi:hypothetical protein